ncbi:MAG: hypothetical protein ACD_48C00176G0001 [uncultured bacterium]|nr:MAG: hypothetical protein ACD_48C00176G0001 [uncultured bacterium]
MKNRNKLIFPSLFLIPAIAGILCMDLAGIFNYTDNPFFFVFAVYVIFVFIQRSQSRFTFSIAMLLLIYMGLSYIPAAASRATERFGEWFYLFFVFGLIQYGREIYIRRKL